jgi:heme a synthase
MQLSNTFLNIARVASALALFVIILGAYVRLSDAGLGCPDWPGCYGNLIVPDNVEKIDEANVAYPERPLEQAKAWKEMVHRYAASTLGLLILVMALLAWIKSEYSNMRMLATVLLVLVIFQGLLGMWTVTLLLKPVIVMAHLLGGLTLVSMLYWTTLRQQSRQGVFVSAGNRRLLPLAIIALIILVLQISLGGWTSSNYAALACPDFPTCQGVWWPNMDFNEGFVLWRGLGVDYEGGVLHGSARTAIHMAHRIGAVITFFTVLVIAVQAIMSGMKQLQLTGIFALILLLVQLSLGVANVMLSLPLPVAVAHNGVAAVLLLALVTLLHHCLPEN